MLKDYKNRLLVGLSILTLLITGFYLLYQIDFEILFYQAPSRIRRVAAIVIVGVAIAVSTVIFQTIVKNRILTPSIMGLDSVYVFIQTTIVFVAGVSSPLLLNSQRSEERRVGKEWRTRGWAERERKIERGEAI